jgi:hypothetical protein
MLKMTKYSNYSYDFFKESHPWILQETLSSDLCKMKAHLALKPALLDKKLNESNI